MEMDDDFLSDAEFNLTPEQGALVNKAINVAALQREDEFVCNNPLIAILQWWQENIPESQYKGVAPEVRLVEACRSYISAHSD